MGWGYESYYRPYVPVAQRKAKAAREVAKRQKAGQTVSPVKVEGLKITKTFWGNSWCQHLESYSDFANRLPRGRTYVRNGSVVDLKIEKGKITALVSGSELYDIVITINELPKSSWSAMKTQCAGQIGSLVELLQGKLSKEVMEIVTRRDTGLFPKPSEIKKRCSCPDSPSLCKHLAAVLYGVGNRLDSQPELLFLLRHVDHLELIDTAGQADLGGRTAAKGKKTLAVADLSDMFGVEMAGPDSSPAPKKSKSSKSATARSQSTVETSVVAKKTAARKSVSNASAPETTATKKPPAKKSPAQKAPAQKSAAASVVPKKSAKSAMTAAAQAKPALPAAQTRPEPSTIARPRRKGTALSDIPAASTGTTTGKKATKPTKATASSTVPSTASPKRRATSTTSSTPPSTAMAEHQSPPIKKKPVPRRG